MLKPLWSLSTLLLVVWIAVGGVGWGPWTFAGAREVKPKAPVPQTGQTTSYAQGDDGDIQAGVTWLSPRFTDRGDGTVRDNLTGLIWLKDASCVGSGNWTQAFAAVADLNAGTDFGCEDYRAGTLTDWRVPNVRELHSLIAFGFFSPALANAAETAQWANGNAFSGVQVASYWSSTTAGSDPSVAFSVYFGSGNIFAEVKTSPVFVWPVHGDN
jgi:hypothetical protein